MDSEEKKLFWKLVNRFDEFAEILDEWDESIRLMQQSNNLYHERIYNLEVVVMSLIKKVDNLSYEVYKKAPA